MVARSGSSLIPGAPIFFVGASIDDDDDRWNCVLDQIYDSNEALSGVLRVDPFRILNS